LLHSQLSYYNMHFNYTVIYYCFALNWRVLLFKDWLALFIPMPWSTWVYVYVG
jgi:hypothetical protein